MKTPEEPAELRELARRSDAERREEKARRDAILLREAEVEVDAKIAEQLDDNDEQR